MFNLIAEEKFENAKGLLSQLGKYVSVVNTLTTYEGIIHVITHESSGCVASHIKLESEKLTDGSYVYNIHIW